MADEKKRLKGQDLLNSIEAHYMKDKITSFQVGDAVEVGVRISEGDKTRVQLFTGTCIARKGSGNRETFTVRRIVQGEGVERIFPLHSPTSRASRSCARAACAGPSSTTCASAPAAAAA